MLQNKELGLPMPAKTKSTNVHFKRADLPKQENVNLNDIDSTTLMSMGKNLSANDISAINSMLDQARARPVCSFCLCFTRFVLITTGTDCKG
jgi:hypothetical protein